MRGHLTRAALAACVFAGAAAAQEQSGATVTVTVAGVHSNDGAIVVSLCDDPQNVYCASYYAEAPAGEGETVLTFEGVAPGRYLLAAFHDENGDGAPQIPPEGYAYGNGGAWPPNFDMSSIQVEGDMAAPLTLTYLTAQQFGQRPTGSTGAPAPEGVTKIDVREGGLYGEFYAPDGAAAAPLPGLILLGGSEGGIDAISGMAPSFATHGYAVLALAYWGEAGLPETLEEIPLEYFDAGVAWLAGRPEVRADAIGALGWSRGSEAALLLAARNPAVRAVAGIAPSGLVWQGLDFADPMNMGPAWTVDGEPLPYAIPDPSRYAPNAPMAPMFDSALAGGVPQDAEIPVERIGGPVLLISGGDDAMWPSETFADRIAARLEAADFAHKVENLVYPGAGHAVFVGAPDGMMAQNLGTPSPMLGGTAEANLAAWRDNWPRALAFFEAALDTEGDD